MKAIAFAVVAAALLCAVAQAECKWEGDDSGNITYKISDGVLTLTGKGNGKMMSYSSAYSYPWSSSDCKTSVTKIVVESSVHSIGAYAFQNFLNLTTVTIAAKPISIKSYAFQGASELRDVIVTGAFDEIATNAFTYCNLLTDLSIICDNCTIRQNAFYSIGTLESLFIKGSIGVMETQSIYFNRKLRKLILPAGIVKVYGNSVYNNEALDLVYYWGDKDVCDGTNTKMFSSCPLVGPVLVPPSYNSTFFCGNEVKKVTTPVSGASHIAVSVLVTLAMLVAALLA